MDRVSGLNFGVTDADGSTGRYNETDTDGDARAEHPRVGRGIGDRSVCQCVSSGHADSGADAELRAKNHRHGVSCDYRDALDAREVDDV